MLWTSFKRCTGDKLSEFKSRLAEPKHTTSHLNAQKRQKIVLQINKIVRSWPLGPRPFLGFSDQKTTERLHRPEYLDLQLVSEDKYTALLFGQDHGPCLDRFCKMNQAILEVKIWIPTMAHLSQTGVSAACHKVIFAQLLLTLERVRPLAHRAFAFTTTYQITMQTSAAKTCKTLAAAACIATGVGLACHWYRAKTQGMFANREHLSTSLRSVPPFTDIYVGPIHLCESNLQRCHISMICSSCLISAFPLEWICCCRDLLTFCMASWLAINVLKTVFRRRKTLQAASRHRQSQLTVRDLA